jgi:ABC-type glycerol-3-phosphate transport system substrate-binding protein
MTRSLLLSIIAFVVVGCNSFSSPARQPQDEALANTLPAINRNISDEPVTLEVWLDLDFTRDNSLYEELADEFESAYPQVEVEIYSFVRESIPERVELEVLSDVPPDVVQGHVLAMAARGLAEPLDQQWSDWERENARASAQFLPTALDEVTWQGTRYGVPLDVYTIVLIYNREHFDQANLPYPEGDYDLFYLQEAAQALTDPEKERHGLGLTTDPWYIAAWINGAGGTLLSETPEGGYTLDFGSSINIETLTFLKNIVDAGYAPRPSSRPRDYEDARRQFLEGKISMYFGEAQDIHLIQSSNPDFPLGVSQLPLTPARERAVSVLGSSGLFIPRGSRHKEIAFEFIKWMTSDKYVLPMARRQGRFPAKVWLQTTPEFTKNLSLLPFFDQLDAARPYRLDVFPFAEQTFSDAVKQVFYDLATPTEALENAQLRSQDTVVKPAP